VPNRAGEQEHPIRNVSLYKIDHHSLPSRPQIKICAQRLIDAGATQRRTATVDDGTYRQVQTFLFKRRAFILKSRMPRLENTMNIFYIIGVVVVIIFVAGFFGLHV
jgi:hypothetical protein